MYYLRRFLALISLVLIIAGMWNNHKKLEPLKAQYDLPVEIILAQHRDENREGIRFNTTSQNREYIFATCRHKKLYGNSLTAKVMTREETPLLLSSELKKGEGKVLLLAEDGSILFQSELPFNDTTIPLAAGEYDVITIGKKCTADIILSGSNLEIEIV